MQLDEKNPKRVRGDPYGLKCYKIVWELKGQ